MDPVREQGDCGACWAFTTADTIQSYNKIAGGKLQTLSPQQLIDCTNDDFWGQNGCDGGTPDFAFFYTGHYQLAFEKDYPYAFYKSSNIKKQACRYTKSQKGVKTTGMFVVRKHDVNQLKAALLKGPVAVSVDADNSIFKLYFRGTITSKDCGSTVGHTVTAVGYSTDADGQDYVLVKNQWGTAWGLNGYARISLSQADQDVGVCGVLTEGFYSTVTDP